MDNNDDYERIFAQEQVTTPRSPSPKAITTLWLIVILSIISSVTGLFFKPFAPIESALMVFFFSVPFAALFFRVTEKYLENVLGVLNTARRTPLTKPTFYSTLFFFYVLFVVGVAFSSNIVLDTSLPDPKTFIISGTHISASKGTYYYKADIKRPDFVRAPFAIFTTESIPVDQAEYRRIVIGTSRITLNTHPGALGMPWYESTYILHDLSKKPVQTDTVYPSDPLIQKKAQPNDQAEKIKAACLWRDHFNPDTDIEKIAPDDYHRDYWSGGEPRSVEPMVKGANHGIGHYTFANGTIYGDIPWKHGKKHGSFMLYHEDGTRDQHLSYKDGQVYGINEWFLPNGEVQQAWLYLDDNTPLPIRVCDPYRTH